MTRAEMIEIVPISTPEETVLDKLCKNNTWDNMVPIKKEGHIYHIYITTDIADPSVYSELCHTLMYAATPADKICMHINTPGGIIDSANMIYDAMQRCKAPITAMLSGTVASAGSILTMGADMIEVADGTAFLAHNYSGGIQGSGHEMKAQQKFTDGQLGTFFNNIYNKFFTPTEIAEMIEGKPFWLTKQEVLTRWDRKVSK